MAYLGYKQKALRKHKNHMAYVKKWKAEHQRKKLELKRKRDCLKATVVMTMVAILMVLAYIGVGISLVKSQPIGVGNFVMAVSYTDSYKDLQYVANFPNCDMAQNYYNQNCIDAKIMLCQLEQYIQLPDSYTEDFTYASKDKHSCGFVGVQQTHTFIEE